MALGTSLMPFFWLFVGIEPTGTSPKPLTAFSLIFVGVVTLNDSFGVSKIVSEVSKQFRSFKNSFEVLN